MTRGNRFTVRKQTSGYTGRPSWYVYDRQRKSRVSVHAAPSPEFAQANADSLNRTIGWDDGKPGSEWTREEWDAFLTDGTRPDA